MTLRCTTDDSGVEGIEEFDTDSVDWRDYEAAFRIMRNPDGGYTVEASDGQTAMLASAGDSFETMLGDKSVTVSLQDSQYYNFYMMGKLVLPL